MRLITARQAWHDCFYNGVDSPIAKLAEAAALGAHIQNTAFHNSTNRACHIAQAGKVQSAIHSLPVELQITGRWLYAPLTTQQANNLGEELQDIIWHKSGLIMRGKEKERAYWLIRAVMRDYQDLVLGRAIRLGTPQSIRGWLLDNFGVDLRTSKDWWQRGTKQTTSKLWATLDDLDAAALAPLSAIIATQREAA